ncbi:MAG: sodium:solute symporter [Hyphomonadaceae bacterium]|nr:sodium:solute symporter [Hyphomonadaceae bacterium]
MGGVAFSALDWAVVGLYFVVNTAICIWAALLKEKDTTDYFLASRSAGWWLIGSSIFASNIGAEHLIGLAGQGASDGMAFAHWELHSYLVLVLGWVFAPFYIRAGIFTTPEFLEKRYTPGTRTFLSLIFLVSYVLTKASVTIFAGAFAIQTILGWQTLPGTNIDFFWFSAYFLVIITGAFVVVGGMKSVLWTEAMHVPVLLVGSAVLLFVGLAQVGGLDELLKHNEDTRHLWAPLQDAQGATWVPRDFSFLFDNAEGRLPWLGVLLASPIVGLWYWCTDQYIAQRVMTAKNLKEARRGAIFAGYLKLVPLFIFLLPGMIAVALMKQGAPGFAGIADNPGSAFPVLVSELLPVGLRGLVLAGMLSALMSALASLFNSTATLFTVDFYKRLRPSSSEKQLVFVGRLATAGVILLGMAWIPFLQTLLGNGALYQYLQLVQTLLAPSIAAVFMLGIFSKTVTPISGFVGLVFGFVAGMSRLAMQVLHESYGVEWGPVQGYVDMNFLYFGALLFASACLVIYATSMVTPKAAPEKLAGLTYGSITPEQRAAEKGSYGFWEILHTVVILAIIAGIYIYFW